MRRNKTAKNLSALAVGLAILFISAPIRSGTQMAFSGELELVFYDALSQGETKTGTKNLILMLDADGGRWGRAFGVAHHNAIDSRKERV